MDRRTLLAVFLCVSIYYGWLMLRGPSAPPPQEGPTTTDVAPPDPAAPVSPAVTPAPVAPPMPDLPVRELPLQGCSATGHLSTRGGVLQDVTLVGHEEPYDVRPIWSWLVGLLTGQSSTPWKPYGEDPGPARLLSPDSLALAASTGPFAEGTGPAPPVFEVVQEGAEGVVLRGVTADGIVVEKRIRATSEQPCVLQADVTWSNPTGNAYAGLLWLAVHDHVPEGGGGMLASYKSIEQPVLLVDGDLIHGDTSIERAEQQQGPVSWFGLADRYFGFIVLPDDRTGTAWLSRRVTDRGTLYGQHYVVSDQGLAAGATHTASFRAYLGPLELDTLRAVDHDLTEIVNFGWFAFFAHPLLWLLKVFHAGVQNWGIAIMLLTLLVKVIFFPLTQSAFKSGQAMQALQPKMQEIREKYKDNQEELNRRTMELFKEHGVNPLGGCLPMLVQFPVWIALYNVLLSSVELYHTEFLWLKDLSSADPTGILPAVVVVLMLVQQSLAPTGNLDPVQARVMKLMPLMFGFFFFAFPSGLVVYIFVNMVLSILQQWLIKRQFEPTAPATA